MLCFDCLVCPNIIHSFCIHSFIHSNCSFCLSSILLSPSIKHRSLGARPAQTIPPLPKQQANVHESTPHCPTRRSGLQMGPPTPLHHEDLGRALRTATRIQKSQWTLQCPHSLQGQPEPRPVGLHPAPGVQQLSQREEE